MKTAEEIYNKYPMGFEVEKENVLCAMEEYASQFKDLSDYHKGWKDCLEANELDSKGKQKNCTHKNRYRTDGGVFYCPDGCGYIYTE